MKEKMNARQRKAFIAIKEAAGMCCAYENTLLDYLPDADEYKDAMEYLNDTEGIKAEVYNTVINDLGEKEIRFLGKKWIMEQVVQRLIKFDLMSEEGVK